MTSSQPPRTRRSWDTILTIILVILFAGWAIVCAFAGVTVAFAGDSCGASSQCNTDQIGAALYLGIGGPLVIGLVIVIATIVRMVRKRLSFFVPLIGFVLTPAIVLAAYLLAANAIVPIG